MLRCILGRIVEQAILQIVVMPVMPWKGIVINSDHTEGNRVGGHSMLTRSPHEPLGKGIEDVGFEIIVPKQAAEQRATRGGAGQEALSVPCTILRDRRIIKEVREIPGAEGIEVAGSKRNSIMGA